MDGQVATFGKQPPCGDVRIHRDRGREALDVICDGRTLFKLRHETVKTLRYAAGMCRNPFKISDGALAIDVSGNGGRASSSQAGNRAGATCTSAIRKTPQLKTMPPSIRTDWPVM